MKCDVVLKVTLIEKLRINTYSLNWEEATKKAIEKIKNKYRWKEPVYTTVVDWEYINTL